MKMKDYRVSNASKMDSNIWHSTLMLYNCLFADHLSSYTSTMCHCIYTFSLGLSHTHDSEDVGSEPQHQQLKPFTCSRTRTVCHLKDYPSNYKDVIGWECTDLQGTSAVRQTTWESWTLDLPIATGNHVLLAGNCLQLLTQISLIG